MVSEVFYHSGTRAQSSLSHPIPVVGLKLLILGLRVKYFTSLQPRHNYLNTAFFMNRLSSFDNSKQEQSQLPNFHKRFSWKVSFCTVILSLSLSHTHTHIHTHILSLSHTFFFKLFFFPVLHLYSSYSVSLSHTPTLYSFSLLLTHLISLFLSLSHFLSLSLSHFQWNSFLFEKCQINIIRFIQRLDNKKSLLLSLLFLGKPSTDFEVCFDRCWTKAPAQLQL